MLYTSGGNQSICSGATATISVTPDDKSVLFNGSNGRIDIPNSSAINTSVVQNRTVALWFKANDTSSRQVLFEEGAGVNGFSIFLEGGEINVHAWESNTSWGQVSTSVSSGSWYHVAFVFDSGAADGEYFKGYLNGVYFGGNSDSNGSNGMNAHSGDITIGQSDGIRFPDGSTPSGNYYNGYIDEFKLWNRSLSGSELFAESFNVNDGSGSGANLVVYYTFNNDSGSSIIDQTGGNNGTLYNGVTHETETPFTPAISWSPGGMTTFSTDVSPSSNTTYTFTLTDPNSGCQETGTITVSVNSPNPATIGGNGPVCSGADAIFTISGTAGNTVSYSGAISGNVVIGSGGTVDLTVTGISSATTINLTNVNDGTCDLPLTGVSATVNIVPTPSVSLAVSDASVCNPASGNAVITITNAGNGVFYELQDLSGNALSPAVSGTGTGSDLNLTILQANVPTTTTSYKIVASQSGCAAVELTDRPTITVDNAGPVFSNCPVNIVQDIDPGYCTAVVSWDIPTVNDNCDGVLNPTVSASSGETISLSGGKHQATIAVGTLLVPYTTITYSATDAAGHTTTCSFTITVKDLTAPVITQAPDPQTVFCVANLPEINTLAKFTAAGGVYTDNAGSSCGSVDVSYTDDAPVGQTVTRHYTLTDAGGNSATCDQVFTISQPVVAVSSQTTTTCIGDSFTITDNTTYSGTIYRQWQKRANSSGAWTDISGETGVNYSGNLGSFDEQYQLLVSENNLFTDALCVAVSNAIQFADTTDPYFTSFAPQDQEICTAPGQNTAAASNMQIDAIDVVDNCTVDLLTGLSYSISGAGATTAPATGVNLANSTQFNEGVSTVTYTVTDAAGNTAQHVITITVKAAPAPIAITGAVVSGAGTATAPNQCGTYSYQVEESPEAGYTYQWVVYSGSGTLGTVVNSGFTLVNTNSPAQPAKVEISWTGEMAAGTYTIEAIKTSLTSGCDTRAILEINIQNQFNLTVNDPGQDCKGESLGSKIIDWTIVRTCGAGIYSFDYVIAAGEYTNLADALSNAIADMPQSITGTDSNPLVINQTVDYGSGGDFYTTQVFTLFIYNQQDDNSQTDINAADDYQHFYLKAIPNTSEISTN